MSSHAALARLKESVGKAAAALGVSRDVDLSDLGEISVVAIAVVTLTTSGIIDIEARALLS